MKQFLSFVHKEFHHILRDGRTMLILLGMPVVQILLFGFAINMEVQHIRTAIFDPAQDAATRDITGRLAANPYFHVVGHVYSPDEINTLLKQGKIDVAIVYEQNFNENLVHAKKAQLQIIADASNPNTGSIVADYVTAIVGGYHPHIPYRIEVENKLLYNPEMKSAYTFVPGIMGLVLMIICAIMTSISIVREKERGTMEVLLASPLKPGTVLISKTVPYLALSFINLVTILLLSYFVLGVPIRGNLALLVAISLLFIFLALSLGLLISTLVQTQVTAVLVSGIGLMMPTLILSGMIFPIGNMPAPLQWASSVVPARWYIAAVKKVMIEGLGFTHVAKETGILAGMVVLLIGTSISKIKNRL